MMYGHIIYVTDEDMIEVGNTDELIYDTLETFSEFDIRHESEKEEERFYASTPKRSYPCEKCEKGSECVDCIALHILGRHGVARALFP